MSHIFCTKCGHPLTQYQRDVATADAGYAFDATAAVAMTFACSSYTDEAGCQGNDPEEMACWWAPAMLDDD
jgi:hypothetical protein